MATRTHASTFYCKTCRTWQKAESAFGQWIRENPALDAQKGYCVVDEDYVVHKFRTELGRDFQLMMIVEIKTLGTSLTEAQMDTLYMLNQLLRNRRDTPTKTNKPQAGTAPVRVKSTMTGKQVVLRHHGVHVLSFSGNGPQDSQRIRWNNSPIDIETLTKLLRFDLDPDSLQPYDFRRHHHVPQPTLPLAAVE